MHRYRLSRIVFAEVNLRLSIDLLDHGPLGASPDIPERREGGKEEVQLELPQFSQGPTEFSDDSYTAKKKKKIRITGSYLAPSFSESSRCFRSSISK